LLPGGWLLLEHGHDQGDAVRQLLMARGFVTTSTRVDLAGLPRSSGGHWPSAT
jgi:release factor glutamine methyltransferase